MIAGASIVLQVILGTNDDDESTLRIVRRVARRQGSSTRAGAGIIFLEIDGLALPVLRRAMQSGSAPTMARWMADGDYRLSEWETDLSSQTGASQAGILLGSNEDIPAFRWVEKERDHDGLLLAGALRGDRAAALERRRPAGGRRRQPRQPALGRRGGDDPDRQPDGGGEGREPGYRAFFADGVNVTQALALFFWEVLLGGRPPRARSAATSSRAVTAAAATRSCAARSA